MNNILFRVHIRDEETARRTTLCFVEHRVHYWVRKPRKGFYATWDVTCPSMGWTRAALRESGIPHRCNRTTSITVG